MAELKNAQREKFCTLLVRGMPIMQAYIKAGYKRDDQNPYRLRYTPEIKERIAELTEQAADRAGVTKEWVLRQFRKNALAGLAVIPKFNEDGQFTHNEIANLAASNQALDKIGKHLTMFPREIKHTGELSFHDLVKNSWGDEDDTGPKVKPRDDNHKPGNARVYRKKKKGARVRLDKGNGPRNSRNTKGDSKS